MVEAMTKEKIRKLIRWLQARITLSEGGDGINISFDEPDSGDFRGQDFGDDVIGLTLEREWWAEMAMEIVETPDFAEPDESTKQVLDYARDVVSEYIRKRLGA